MTNMKSSFGYIVIGGGIAGVSCAEQLYNYDDTCSILLISASDFVKTVTNLEYVTKTLHTFDVEEKPADTLEKHCPSISIIKSPVTKLDSHNQIVYTKEGQFKYGRLCICSGAVPKVLFPNNPHVLWIRDTESIKSFQAKLSEAKRMVIIGNGGIATEMVYEITGIEIIWVIKDKSLNAVFIDAGAAEFLHTNLCEDKAVGDSVSKRRKYTIDNTMDSSEVIGGALGPDWHSDIDLKGDNRRRVVIESEAEVVSVISPQEIEKPSQNHQPQTEGEWPVYVKLTNGKVYGCDFVVSATGVRPNTEPFLDGNDFVLGSDGGISIDEHMESSIPLVYAAGDVCYAGWNWASHWFQFRLWTQARQMGAYAARCMWAATNKEEIYMDFCFEMFSHATKFLGYKVILLGLFNGQKLNRKYEILLRMSKGEEYIKCVMANGRMQGAILIGETNLEETFENLILNQMDLSSYGEDLLDPSVDIEDYFD